MVSWDLEHLAISSESALPIVDGLRKAVVDVVGHSAASAMCGQ